MTNLFEITDYKGGRLFNTNSAVYLDVKLENQLFNLIQDITQIYYDEKNITIDIGWYPSDFEVVKASFFWIQIIYNQDWDEPLFERKVKSIEELKSSLEDSITYITTYQK